MTAQDSHIHTQHPWGGVSILHSTLFPGSHVQLPALQMLMGPSQTAPQMRMCPLTLGAAACRWLELLPKSAGPDPPQSPNPGSEVPADKNPYSYFILYLSCIPGKAAAIFIALSGSTFRHRAGGLDQTSDPKFQPRRESTPGQ